uniref:winged helix-turn-helix transcriptional regulator n=1 Tax=Lentzea alba TaxID=2714351 RepID=UPI0039BF06A3
MCPCRDLLDMVASKWTALAIGALEDGPKRFGELKRRLDGVSQKMLTQTLRTLERDGLVTRTVYPTVPLRVEYELTALGRSVTEPLAALRSWAQRNYESVAEAREIFDNAEPLEPVTAR